MSWLFSRVLVEAYSEAICSDGEQSAPLSGNPMPQAYLCSDKMMGFSRLSRFGMTFKLLTENRGEALLTSYLEDFPVRTSQPQEKAQELMESAAECGEKWRGSFAKWSQDSYSWKTHQCSLLGGLDEFLGTWPQWGLMRHGECWEQQTLGQTIRGTESGLSPNGVDSFHTPNTTGLDGGSNSRKALKKKMEQWPTPISQDAKHSGYAKSGPGKAKKLSYEVVKYPTPTCHNAKEGDYPAEHTRKTPSLATHAGGKLNPMWVEWLMGWPLGWTDLKPLETDKYHYAQLQHGES